jgi:hypothetical protein
VGTRGPIGKRDDERIRRNTPDVPTTTISVIGAVAPPELDIELPHPLVVDMYESLRDSAQARYFEPSDWQYARLTMYAVNDMLKGKGDEKRISPMMLASVNSMLSSLLVTEGDRRRVRIEVERNTSGGEQGKVLQVADLFRQELTRRPGSPGGGP